jgi:dihydroxyacid dehydratase/phosphogluconate dehydratase
MVYRSWMRSQGFTPEVFDGRPVIGIATTWSELAPCNVHLHRVAESVKRGVWQAGGFPLEFPAMALGETILRPTAMLYRNLLAMEAEELMRANPLDGVVLLSGCDKTTPGLLMAAASVDLPAVMVTGGPDAQRKVPGYRRRLGHGGLAVRGRPARRADDPGGMRVRRRLHGQVQRALHDDGHRVHHGVDGRSARHAAAVLGDLARRGRAQVSRPRSGPAR